MAQIIKARFMHQHKDRAVYEREIVLDTPSLNQYYGKTTTYLEFNMPLLLGIEPEFVKRWVKSDRICRVTRRSMRFIGSDGKILCELSGRPLKAELRIPESFDRDITTIRICCIVEKDEIKELSKIFFPKYFEDLIFCCNFVAYSRYGKF